MRLIIQRVNHAEVIIDNKTYSKIGKGFLILFGCGEGDDENMLQKIVDKTLKMRIFSDENGKTNLSLADVNGELLIVSQFTLYADCRKGNRPSFTKACEPVLAEHLYNTFVAMCREQTSCVKTGIFGADMQIELENDGPFTIILDSNDLFSQT